MKKPCIGIALGSGSARGWAHIGVLHALADIGIYPEIVSGCSVGAIVGAAYAAGNLDTLENWVLSLSKLDLIKFFGFNPTLNGLVSYDKLEIFFHEQVCDTTLQIKQLPRIFASVATNLENGREVWFTDGKVIDAIRASMALPGLFPPYPHKKQWLVDGGLVNPVPVSLCRALGADIIIAVNLNGNIARRYARHTRQGTSEAPGDNNIKNNNKTETLADTLTTSLREYSSALFPDSKDKNMPGLMDAIAASINIMQDKITRSRMAGDPPEILLTPRLEHLGLLEFFRASEAIDEGYQTVERMRPEIENLLTPATL